MKKFSVVLALILVMSMSVMVSANYVPPTKPGIHTHVNDMGKHEIDVQLQVPAFAILDLDTTEMVFDLFAPVKTQGEAYNHIRDMTLETNTKVEVKVEENIRDLFAPDAGIDVAAILQGFNGGTNNSTDEHTMWEFKQGSYSGKLNVGVSWKAFDDHKWWLVGDGYYNAKVTITIAKP